MSRDNDSLETKIAETNLTYLLLAQQLIRDDKPTALVRLGISEEVAELLENLTTQQVLKIASGNTLIAGLQFTQPEFWEKYTQSGRSQSASKFHASILMSSKSIGQPA